MREHTLPQAIARVNRPYVRTLDGVTTEKQHGLVIDYCGVSRELDAALATFDQGDVEDALRELPEDPGPVIQAAAPAGLTIMVPREQRAPRRRLLRRLARPCEDDDEGTESLRHNVRDSARGSRDGGSEGAGSNCREGEARARSALMGA